MKYFRDFYLPDYSISGLFATIKGAFGKVVRRGGAMESGIKLAPISVVHGREGCTGVIVPIHLFVTSERKLRVLGVCNACNKNVFGEITLDELARHCPTPAFSEGITEMSGADIKYLRALGVAI